MRVGFESRAVVAAFVMIGTCSAGGAIAQTESAEEEFRVFEADLGPAWIDVTAYPEEQRGAYTLFAQKCCKCHTLARPINSTLRGDEWVAYVNRMSRKPGSGISPKDVETIQGFLIFDSERRVRQAGSMDPELVPFVRVSEELGGVERFPASLRDIRVENGSLRVRVEGDRRLDLSRFFESGDGQTLVKWTRKAPHQGEVVMQEAASRREPASGDLAAAENGPLREAVTEAVGDEPDPRERVELILDWLDEEMTRAYRKGAAGLGEILAERQGDSTEFTSAFVAMARAAGVPARECLGFVARRTAFYLQPWAEVWLDGWIPVDPYLGQFPADLTHIRLSVPDGGRFADWDPGRVPGLDRLQLRVVVSEAEPGKDEG